MKILFLAAEAAPFVKVGGLGDVAGSLPRALARLGHDVRVAIPGYGAIDRERFQPRWRARFEVPHAGGAMPAELWETANEDVPVYLLTGPPIPTDRRIYGGSIREDAPKFLFFSLAAVAACRELSWKPDVVHANDWHTGPAVYRLAVGGGADEFFRDTATVFTIHNLPYTGRDAGSFLGEWGLPPSRALFLLPGWARESLLGLGLVTADVLSTVSPTYAREIRTPEGGYGLDGALRARGDRLHGILNGIDTDVWSPASDPELRERFDGETLEKRSANRAALREEAGLDADGRAFVLGMVSRLDSQKGFDIAVPALWRWVDAGGQVVILGSGDEAIASELAALERGRPGSASVRFRFDPPWAHRIYGGADALLIPSRYEPCGLTQMIAMRYGAVPIARRTGGLADTITDVGDADGTGILFDGYDTGSLVHALERAVRVYAQPHQWADLQRRGMTRDFSWNRSAGEYESLYREALRLRRDTRPGEHD
ncbi:MAG TPA: glycogen/starch synthase [Thermoanaerobaculia bacterium]|nr:glycogen/starch synthase [Thermoanaerobaculia bacterium]